LQNTWSNKSGLLGISNIMTRLLHQFWASYVNRDVHMQEGIRE